MLLVNVRALWRGFVKRSREIWVTKSSIKSSDLCLNRPGFDDIISKLKRRVYYLCSGNPTTVLSHHWPSFTPAIAPPTQTKIIINSRFRDVN
ncbi:hypothetical protein QVD17_35792 [Tagetes erecta]|uniref:Uncharacterized protein n=1 Tax=Tagetes erecta TaxID=13708 RepID=A0AAD8JTB5_TARER|nr:hypothetical protein QVD17_35792 [Tagetes erecta]